jgi:hypothetical protein
MYDATADAISDELSYDVSLCLADERADRYADSSAVVYSNSGTNDETHSRALHQWCARWR